MQQILKPNCPPCHNDTTKSSGLALTTRDAILAGGNRGTAVKPGNPADSLLVRAIEQSGELKMPPGRKLKPNEIATLRHWIELGVAWPTDEVTASRPKGSDWWAFQPVRRVNPPSIEDAAWMRNPIDQFILSRLEKEHLRPSSEASKETLLRRVSLDLTGIVPSPREIRDFLADTSPDAYERVVDRLLASPHYGERWGRHWPGGARYAPSHGCTIAAPPQMPQNPHPV